MSLKIMVVDDEAAIRRLLNYQLTAAGHTVTLLPNGQEALDCFATQQPDLVLLDVMMPGLLGWEVCHRIRSFSDVPIIMLTSKGTEEDVNVGLGAGADHYLVKPYSTQQLLGAVSTVMEQRGLRVDKQVGNWSRLRQRLRNGSGGQENYPLQLSEYEDIGHRLREVRQRHGWSLYRAEILSRVRWDFIQAMERGDYLYIPREQRQQTFTRYSQFLGIDLYTFDLPPDPYPTVSGRAEALPSAVLVALIFLLLVGALGAGFWWVLLI